MRPLPKFLGVCMDCSMGTIWAWTSRTVTSSVSDHSRKTKRKGKKKSLQAYQHVHAEQERRGAEELGVGQVLNRRILATERIFHACREETARECEQSCAAQ